MQLPSLASIINNSNNILPNQKPKGENSAMSNLCLAASQQTEWKPNGNQVATYHEGILSANPRNRIHLVPRNENDEKLILERKIKATEECKKVSAATEDIKKVSVATENMKRGNATETSKIFRKRPWSEREDNQLLNIVYLNNGDDCDNGNW